MRYKANILTKVIGLNSQVISSQKRRGKIIEIGQDSRGPDNFPPKTIVFVTRSSFDEKNDQKKNV